MAEKNISGVGRKLSSEEGNMGVWINSETSIRLQMDVVPDCMGTADVSLATAKKLRDLLSWAIEKIEGR